MSDQRVPVETRAWNRFALGSVMIGDDLLGAEHVFAFSKHTVTVRMPDKSMVDRDETYDQIAVTRSWREVDGKRTECGYEVLKADVLVDVEDAVQVPPEVLTRSAVRHEPFTEQERKYLTTIAVKYGEVAYGAYDNWVRTIRWIMRYGGLGQPEISSRDTGWGTYLRQRSNDYRFWSSPVALDAGYAPTITVAQWQKAQAALAANIDPPIWFDLFFEGEQRLKHNDLRSATLNFSVAAESAMRAVFVNSFGSGLTANTVDILDTAGILWVLDKHIKQALTSLDSPTYSTIHTLLNARNKLAHLGRGTKLDRPTCEVYRDAYRALVFAADDHLLTTSS